MPNRAHYRVDEPRVVHAITSSYAMFLFAHVDGTFKPKCPTAWTYCIHTRFVAESEMLAEVDTSIEGKTRRGKTERLGGKGTAGRRSHVLPSRSISTVCSSEHVGQQCPLRESDRDALHSVHYSVHVFMRPGGGGIPRRNAVDSIEGCSTGRGWKTLKSTRGNSQRGK